MIWKSRDNIGILSYNQITIYIYINVGNHIIIEYAQLYCNPPKSIELVFQQPPLVRLSRFRVLPPSKPPWHGKGLRIRICGWQDGVLVDQLVFLTYRNPPTISTDGAMSLGSEDDFPLPMVNFLRG